MDTQQHAHPKPGDMAPDFRLAAAAGGEVALSDFRGRNSLLLWFSKGLGCPFCRRNMARLSQAYPQFRECGAEILQITLSTLDEARLYFRNYQLPMPYLCDPEREAHLRYGVELEPQSIGAVASNSLTSSLMVAQDLLVRGEKSPWPVPLIMRMGARNQSPQLVLAVDRAGLVRHVQAIGPFDTLPTVSQLLSILEPLRDAQPGTP